MPSEFPIQIWKLPAFPNVLKNSYEDLESFKNPAGFLRCKTLELQQSYSLLTALHVFINLPEMD